MKNPPPLLVESDGIDLFICVDGIKIAKRGKPNTPHAKTWVSLEPGFSVFDDTVNDAIVVEYKAQGRPKTAPGNNSQPKSIAYFS
jgi:hypothetical protein